MHTHKDWVHRMPFFQGCPESFVASLALGMNLRTFAPKELIYEAGDVADDLFVVKRGLVGSRGNPVGAGNVFGVEMLRRLIYEPVYRTHKATTLMYVECYACPFELLKTSLSRCQVAKDLVFKRAVQTIFIEHVQAFSEASHAFLGNSLGRSKNPIVREMEVELLYMRTGVRQSNSSYSKSLRPRYAKQLVKMKEHLWNIGNAVANLESRNKKKASIPIVGKATGKHRRLSTCGDVMLQTCSSKRSEGPNKLIAPDPIALIVASHPGGTCN